MFYRRLQVLPNRQKIHLGDAQVVHHLHDLGLALAQPDHQARLGEDRRIDLLDPVQQPQRLVIPSTGANRGIQPRHSLKIVVEDVRRGCGQRLRPVRLAQEIRRQHLDRRIRRCRPDRADHRREMRRAAIRQIVPVHRGDHHVPQPQLRHRIGDPHWLVCLQRRRLAGAHVAEAARAGAGVAHDHHRRMALRPAFADIRAGRFLAHRDQPVVAHQRAGFVIDRVIRRLDANPDRLPLDRMIRPVRLFRMPERASAAMIDADPGAGHDRRDVEGGRRPVKQANVICRATQPVRRQKPTGQKRPNRSGLTATRHRTRCPDRS